MNNFLRNSILKLATAAMFFGALITGVGLWTMFQERNVAAEPQNITLAEVEEQSDDLLLVTVAGGQLDFDNTFSYELQTRKRRATLKTTYFIPVKNSEDQVTYILGTASEPSALGSGDSVTFTGLLQSSSKLPNELEETYNTSFSGRTYKYLDTTYESSSIGTELGKLGLFFGVFLAGLIVRIFVGRKQAV